MSLSGSAPDAFAFTKWQPVSGYADTSLDLTKLTPVTMSCAQDSRLYPLHPQQWTKIYHIFNWGSYDHSKLTADSEACRLGSKYKNSKGFKSCLAPDTVYYVLMSDVYQDRCGRHYRAFWELTYLKKYESMGTLFSKGRTLYEKSASGLSGEFIEGPTYAVESSEFLFLTEILNGDAARIAEAQKSAQKTHQYNSETRLFYPR